MQSGGGLMQLVAYGAQDIYLTSAPTIRIWGMCPPYVAPIYNDDNEPETLDTNTVYNEPEVLHTNIEYMHDATDDGFDLKFNMGTILDILNDNDNNKILSI
jgi:hypothetical protein